MAYGTLVTLDALASSQQTIASLGEDKVWEGIDVFLAAHNEIMNELLNELVERTTDRLRRFGGASNMTMDEIDELGTPDAEKVTAGQNVGLPLRKYGRALQWTRNYFLVATGEELAAQVRGLTIGDRLNVERQVKRAIFTPTNATFQDRLVDYVDLPVKALINADSSTLPPGPNGESFDGATHTHYLATASFIAANLTSLINTVIEHYGTGEIRVCINKAQEAAVRALSGFTAYVDARIVQPGGSTTATATGQLDMINTGDRAIGIYEAAEIWVKPWVPASYMFGYNRSAPKPLGLRTRTGMGDLQLTFDDESHPLRARGYEREFGVGVVERTNGAVLYTGGGTYAAPTL
jgi:hypothetical protein